MLFGSREYYQRLYCCWHQLYTIQLHSFRRHMAGFLSHLWRRFFCKVGCDSSILIPFNVISSILDFYIECSPEDGPNFTVDALEIALRCRGGYMPLSTFQFKRVSPTRWSFHGPIKLCVIILCVSSLAFELSFWRRLEANEVLINVQLEDPRNIGSVKVMRQEIAGHIEATVSRAFLIK